MGFLATKITGCYLKSWDMLGFFVFLFLVCRFFFVCVWNFVFAFVIPYVDHDDFVFTCYSIPLLYGSKTTQIPYLRFPSCLIMPAFCITDKSRSTVLGVTDITSDICFADNNGFPLIKSLITFWRSVNSIICCFPTFFPTFTPTFTAPFTTPLSLFTPPLSSLLARFLQLHDCHPHRYISCRLARWRNHKSIWGIRCAKTPYTQCSAFLRMLSLPSCLVLCLSFCLIIA